MAKTDSRGDGLATFGLTAVRVVLGLFWISQFSWKPPPTFGCPNEGFCLWVNKEIQSPLIPAYADMLRSIIQPNVMTFGWLTFFAETAIGLSLTFGFLTRLGGLAGTLWSLNLLIGLVAVPGETVWYYLSLLLLNFQYFAIGDRHQISLDRRLGIRL
jgi:uncharacterized membrane protein YphA (DoxX/SURF4 family)